MAETQDSFEANVAAASGVFAGDYLWSNAANWSTAQVPVNGDDVVQENDGVLNIDDLNGLSLSSLTLEETNITELTGDSLTIDTVIQHFDGVLEANSLGRNNVTVTIYGITAQGGVGGYAADGAGAAFVDQAASDPGSATFDVYHSGTVYFACAPASTTVFDYRSGDGSGLFVFENPGTVISAKLADVGVGDALEVPGTVTATYPSPGVTYYPSEVRDVVIGAHSIVVTTDTATYDFTNVTFADEVKGYTSQGIDSSGFSTITFNDIDSFQQNIAASGSYVWSNVANWTGGVPGTASAFTVGAAGVDDLARLLLVNLTLHKTGAEPEIFVTGATLSVDDLLETDPAGTALLEADAADAARPVAITLYENSAHGVTFEANGAGASFDDQSAQGTLASTYEADDGGRVELLNAPLGSDVLTYGTHATFALPGAAADNLALIQGLRGGDVLELPGTSVSSVNLGASSLEIATSAGNYAFDDVGYAEALTNYTTAYDASTGLEAITFRGTDVFTPRMADANGDYLWSNAANWSGGLPVDGDRVEVIPNTAVDSFGNTYALENVTVDDIAALTLSSLLMNTIVDVTGNTLAIGTLGFDPNSLTSDFLLQADSVLGGAPVTVTFNHASLSGVFFTAYGPGARLIDNSPRNASGSWDSYANYYQATDGGFLEIPGAQLAEDFGYGFPDDGFTAGSQLGMLALSADTTINVPNFIGVAPGDVLELPGTTVSSIYFGPAGGQRYPNPSLIVTTDSETYKFYQVSPDFPIGSYTWAVDPATGLVAITFGAPDVFSGQVSAGDGALAGDFLWSNAGNWSAGLPVAGGFDSFASGAVGFDDMAALSLGGLYLNGGEVLVTGASLALGALSGGTVVADAADAGAPVSVTIGSDFGPADDFIAQGTGATLLDRSAYDLGNNFTASSGGLVEISGLITSLSALDYDGLGTIALINPGSVIGATLGIHTGDVLELPGSVVSSLNFGASSVTLTTGAGTYSFTSVSDRDTLADYTTSFDAATGLEAITLTGNSIPDLYAGPAQHDVIFSNVTATNPVIAGGTVELASGSTVTGDISFTGTGGVLVIDANPDGSTTLPANTITGFTAGDTIELAGVPFSGSSANFGAPGVDSYTVASAGTLTIDAAGTIYDLNIAGATIGQHDFVLSNDLQVTEVTCYAAGTRIATPAGEVAVESLQIGDWVKTLHAGAQKIKWIGTRTYDGRFIAGNKRALPICIKAGAIRKNIPARDLWVSPGHAICIDGALIHAARLVNGVSIIQAEQVERITYYHIELETHEIIFAENCLAETFMGEHFRGVFQNAAEFTRLYPGGAAAETMCLPRLDGGFQLHAIQQRISRRAGIAAPAAQGHLRGYIDQAGPDICGGWAQDGATPQAPVCLDITADGRRIGRVLANLYRADLHAAGYGRGYHGFAFRLGAGVTGRIEVLRTADRAVLSWTQNAAAHAA